MRESAFELEDRQIGTFAQLDCLEPSRSLQANPILPFRPLPETSYVDINERYDQNIYKHLYDREERVTSFQTIRDVPPPDVLESDSEDIKEAKIAAHAAYR